ncbi:fatty-acid amide hydrolase 2-like [Hyposmocoma kahamanoa]|uniref:fatty-acid amide hydrolase 2-like n=1 Tax=Hyposmocoma kahamanoa TaxID=1477025 RepID=UPI000E6D8BBE|nr:fatty-acid amide hydrolase 2-like [Hyposmocoma kahamanoa]
MACSTLKTVLCYIRFWLDRVVDFIFSLYWNCKKEVVPDLEEKHAFLAESALTLARKIREKELKSEDLVRAVIERIKQVNPIINAVAEERYVAALDEAREVDRIIAAGMSEEEARKKPFLGVPFTLKESHAMKGMKFTMGLWSRRREVATEDSEALVRLKVAGAIPVATTNLPELLIWQETRNPVYGMTNNPHHTGRTPGGSSGAEAALTASYATTISLCSDLGGSTRMPAFYCGVFGHYPTPGTTNLRGVFFRKGDDTDKDSMLSLGFISKHVEDIAPLTKIVAGDKAHLLKLDRDINIQDIKFFYTESADDCHVSPLTPGMKAAMNRVLAKISNEIKSSGNGPEPYNHEGFGYMYKLWFYWMSKEPDDYASLFNNGVAKANCFVELIKKLTCLSRHCFFTIMRLLELQVLPKVNAEWAEKITKDLKDDLFGKLGDNGVLLFPSAPQPAPYHYSCMVRPYNFAYWGVVNMLKCPAIQVPLGVNSQGLPIGIQVVAAPYNDALCIAVAKYLEKEFGGAVMACKVKHRQ